jgi:UDP-GlcNAc:undecaprenyl-phosphate GlcNAc-1-phosphate transferase
VIALLGVWDDMRGAKARLKFTVQLAAAGLVYALGGRVTEISHPFGEAIQLGVLALPFTLLWIVGVINAMNLIDGLDGLAGGVALTAIATTFVIAVSRGEPLMMMFAATLAGSVLGFLVYNFNPATIFMGDSGSMFLGFVLATTAIQSHQKATTAVAIAVPIIALGVPITDTLLAMTRRAIKGAPMFSADRGHIHHRLLELGLSHRQAVLVLYGASVVLGLTALALTVSNSIQAAFILLGISAVVFVALRRLGYLDIARAQQALVDRRRNLDGRAHVRRAAEELRLARSAGEIWSAVLKSARALGAAGVGLYLAAPRPLEQGVYEDGFDARRGPLFRARYGLLPERPGNRYLELGFDDGRFAIDRDTEIVVELLCEHVSSALERIERGGERTGPGELAPTARQP